MRTARPSNASPPASPSAAAATRTASTQPGAAPRTRATLLRALLRLLTSSAGNFIRTTPLLTLPRGSAAGNAQAFAHKGFAGFLRGSEPTSEIGCWTLRCETAEHLSAGDTYMCEKCGQFRQNPALQGLVEREDRANLRFCKCEYCRKQQD